MLHRQLEALGRRVGNQTQLVILGERCALLIVPANPNVGVSGYTTVDLRTGIDFGRYRVALYATNLLDEYGDQTQRSREPRRS